MTLARRVIPTLLVRDGSLVKGERFESWRSIGTPLQAIRVYESRNVDELILLDIAATPQGRGPDIEMVSAIAEECFTPLTVGGGVRDLDTIRELLKAGADKVAIGTATYDRRFFIKNAARKFGSQCITIAIDVKGGRVMTHCGTRPVVGEAVKWAVWAQDQGAGEILLTSVDRDGTLEGYDLDLIRKVSAAVSIPVIASGGARDYDDFVAAFEAGAHAVAASALFQFTEATPAAAKEAMKQHGIPVRT